MNVKLKSFKKKTKKGLFLVSTPIGNLNDITFRAIETLKNSDYILCEDTRVSKKLLDYYNVRSKLISNHKFNEKKNLLKIIDLLNKGFIISMISDAGTPCISDPGSLLIKECVEKNIEVTPVPGVSSVISAMSISGFSENFFFYGFFPDKEKELLDDLEILSNFNSSIVFFISAKKINKKIPFIKKNFSGRKIIICREMTKFYEEFIRLEVDELEEFKNNLKGELTVVISEKKVDKKASQFLSESDKVFIKKMINKVGIKEISNIISQRNKVSKKLIYNYCLTLKNER
tara:strand:+ start:137 stop:1000 length:864 start_codon:yes stop_codon:yes gene_type:complete